MAWPASKRALIAVFAGTIVAVTAGVCVAISSSAPAPSPAPDGGRASIVNSGSTNALGFAIVVSPGGAASVVLQNRLATSMSSPKPFSIGATLAKTFFADLKAARDGHATGEGCMKSASFGTTTRVTWQGWTSPDLDCPPRGALLAALVHDVGLIRSASGIDTATPLRRGAQPPRARS